MKTLEEKILDEKNIIKQLEKSKDKDNHMIAEMLNDHLCLVSLLEEIKEYRKNASDNVSYNKALSDFKEALQKEYSCQLGIAKSEKDFANNLTRMVEERLKK